MSNRELCIELLNTMPEYKINYVLAYIQGLTAELEDDVYCNTLYKQYLADTDRGEAVSLEEAALLLGVSL